MGSTASHRRFPSFSISTVSLSFFQLFLGRILFAFSPIPSCCRNRTHTHTHTHAHTYILFLSFSIFLSRFPRVYPVLQTRSRFVDPFRLVFSLALARGRNCGYQPRSRYPGNHEESFAFRPFETEEKDRWGNV